MKVKNIRRTDAVIGGWLPGEGGRSGRLGALVVGFYEDGELRYAGRVGSGFTQAELARLGGLLDALAREDSPFEGRQPPRSTRFVEPRLVSVVDYSEVTHAGRCASPPTRACATTSRPRRRRSGGASARERDVADLALAIDQLVHPAASAEAGDGG